MEKEENLIRLIQAKIKSLEDEAKSCGYTAATITKTALGDRVAYLDDRVNECIHKIQVLNEVLMSYGLQTPKK